MFNGAFAITPMVNYLLASLGFLCLLLWATRNGMFRDIESAKERLREARGSTSMTIAVGSPTISPFTPSSATTVTV